MFYKSCVILGLLFHPSLLQFSYGLSSIAFPLKVDYSPQTVEVVKAAFRNVIDSTDFLKPCSIDDETCYIPAFGPDACIKLNERRVTVPSRNNFHKNNHRDSHGHFFEQEKERRFQQCDDAQASTSQQQQQQQQNTMFELSSQDLTKTDFDFVCAHVYRFSKEALDDVIDLSDLKKVVDIHNNRKHLHPGYPADSAKLAGSQKINNIFESSASPKKVVTSSHHGNTKNKEMVGTTTSKSSILETLQTNGFVVIDNNLTPKTSQESHERLSKYLQEKNDQSPNVRTDMVHFLNRDQANECGVGEQFDVLMAIPSYLNQNVDFQEENEEFPPMHPATNHNPLTVPDRIQLAEYGENDFYVAHSDNSPAIQQDGDHLMLDHQQTHKEYDPAAAFTNDNNEIKREQEGNSVIRNNYRRFTCILYCNDDWTKDDGGALRIYPNTRDIVDIDDVIEKQMPYVDILPKNGQLLIFDSCLIHSVEKVTPRNDTKVRRAFTLWVDKPHVNGVNDTS